MVFAFVVFKHFRSHFLVTQTSPVQKFYTAFPVSANGVSRDSTLYIVLSSRKIPHEITPVHIVHLVIKKEEQVVPERRHVFPFRVELSATRVVRIVKRGM